MKKESLLKSISILFILVILSSSCGETYCPAFPEEEADWFPYSIGDKIEFYNGQDTAIYPVVDYYLSDSYSYSKRLDVACEPLMLCKTKMDSIYLFSINMSIFYFANSLDQFPPRINVYMQSYVYNIDLDSYTLTYEDKFSCNERSEFQYHDSLFVNGKIYSKVIDIKGLASNLSFSEVKVAKGHGIIELTQSDTIIWNVVSD